ncbi:hypothetical protein BDP27DRAFT_1368284 [Rhodocollybia butyracea]|uniref:GST N-terminal domain-containing protein n=1 Tax=Rhodocollybia butyracea TaxID=206335 RepID=A0A9P5PGZ1_9AGAR|nr:hypothetical protein BDP27DRAFT_1368284 [Rhodocollybia butyracea]
MITLYDFDGKVKHPWNVSVWKARYSLNFKNVPYKTIWLEYPDIEPKMKKLGARPTGLKPDGSPMYTLPVIHDHTTGAIVSDSALIAEYLDKTYPTTTQLIPTGTHALQAAFREMFGSKMAPLALLVVPQVINKVVNGPSVEYMTRNYLPKLGISNLETWTMSEEERNEHWEKVKALLGSVHGTMKAEDKWIMGGEISFADFVVGSILEMMKTTFGTAGEDWRRVVNWHDGRWDRMMSELEKYSAVY